MTTVADVVRRVFPDASDKEVEFLLLNRTGYPVFWDRMPPERAILNSLRGYKRALKRWGGACEFCNKEPRSPYDSGTCTSCSRALNRVAARQRRSEREVP